MTVNLLSRIAVIGAGQSGLVTAATLLADGFQSVTIICSEKTAGGNWSTERTYPGLVTNGAYFEFRLSGLQYTEEEMKLADPKSGRLPARAVASYLERFADRYCQGHIRYRTRVDSMKRRANEATGWDLRVTDLVDNKTSVQSFDKVVLCTGTSSLPNIPKSLVDRNQFKGLVVHTSELGSKAQTILDDTQPRSSGKDETIVVIGGGKSAADAAAWFGSQDRRVTLVMNESLWHIPLPSFRAPNFLRRSRLPHILMPTPDPKTPLERFLHTTQIGAWLIKFIYRRIEARVTKDLGLAADSPLRPNTSIFWGGRAAGPTNVKDPASLFSLIHAGRVDVVTSVRVVGYGDDGTSVMLDNGTALSAKAIILGTGFKPSNIAYMDQATIAQAGMTPQPPSPSDPLWDYPIFKSAPFPPSRAPVPLICRGIVPAVNWNNRDLALNGFTRNVSGAYIGEASAHWISSYFLEDPFLAVTPEEAIRSAERDAAWLRQRYPSRNCFTDAVIGCNPADALAYWPHYADLLLEDMGVPARRSGRLFMLWPFQTIDVAELATLGEERRVKREKAVLAVTK